MPVITEITECTQDIATITSDVFDSMFGLQVFPLDRAEPVAGCALTAAVQFTGEWKGAVLLHCSEEQARMFTARMLQESDAAVIAENMRDVLGELANVIGGNLKSLLSPGVALSSPLVVDGTNYAVHITQGNLAHTVSFTGDAGIFSVTLVKILEGRRNLRSA